MAHHAKGTVLKRGDGGSPEAFTTLAEMRRIGGPNQTKDSVETTNHDSANFRKEYLPSWADAGTVDFEGNYLPGGATHQAWEGDLEDTTNTNYEVIYSDSGSRKASFAAHMTAWSPDSPHDDKATVSGSLKLTGASPTRKDSHMPLDRDEILELFKSAPEVRLVKLPGGEEVYVRGGTGLERDKFERAVCDKESNVPFRGLLAAMSICDAQGRAEFTEADAERLAAAPAAFLEPITEAAFELWGMNKRDREDYEKTPEARLMGTFPPRPRRAPQMAKHCRRTRRNRRARAEPLAKLPEDRRL